AHARRHCPAVACVPSTADAPRTGEGDSQRPCRVPDTTHGSRGKLLTAPAPTSYAYGLFVPQPGSPSKERGVHPRAECPVSCPQPRRCVPACALSRRERDPRHDDRPVDRRRGEGPPAAGDLRPLQEG